MPASTQPHAPTITTLQTQPNPTEPTHTPTILYQYSNLVLGVVYAVPSGVAVAVAYSNPNSGVLVGVAIAASLLPPCANTGLLLGAT